VPQATTPGEMALHNLTGHIQALERHLESSPSDLALRSQLVDLLLTRTQFTSSFGDFARIAALADHAPEEHPGEAKALLLRARYLGSMHRFAEAEAEYDRAEKLAPTDTRTKRASLHIAEGRKLEDALAVARERVGKLPTLEHYSLLAGAEAALGHYDDADEHYRAALAAYHDVSPLPVAYVEFQRGVMWAELANAPERAIPLYTEAVRRLPQFVVANVHLAELELARGQRDVAEQRLRSFTAQGDDPEPWARLGELLLAAHPGDAGAEALIARAGKRYEELLSEQRTAFLDHAAEFFAGPGANPKRAVELARDNLALRQTGRAYQLAVQSALAAGDRDLACGFISQANAAAPSSRNLSALLEREAGHCAQL
jgi:tetratricopeptide (TPR) repeat protein